MIKRKELYLSILVAIVVSIPLSNMQNLRWLVGHTDTAFLTQTLENIANRGLPVSQIHASTFSASKTWGEDPALVCTDDLISPNPLENNIFSFHTYVVLYILAPLTYIIPAKYLLSTIIAVGYVVLVLLSYILLRKKNVSITSCIVFCFLISAHPAWSQTVFGQIYVDRLFVPLAFLFLYILTNHSSQLRLIFLIGCACTLVVERSGLILGAFCVGYSILMPDIARKLRVTLSAFGITYIASSILLIFLFVTNPHYSSFSSSFFSFFSNLGVESFRDNLLTFLFFNLVVLGFFALFNWQAALLAFFTMLPNVIGNIGGAEKTGWATHYHSLYLPFLIWAAAMGYAELYSKLHNQNTRNYFTVLILSIAILIACINPYRPFNTPMNYFPQNAWARTWSTLKDYYVNREISSLSHSRNFLEQVVKQIPSNVTVSTVEGLMPALYENRTVHYYPIGIDAADFLILPYERDVSGKRIFTGAISYHGAKETITLNICLNERLKRLNYDFENATFIDHLAIIRRKF